MKTNQIEKEILALDRKLEKKNIVLMPDLTKIQIFKDNPKLLQEYLPYLEGSIDFTKDFTIAFKKYLYSPFLFISEMIRKIPFRKSKDPGNINGAGAAEASVGDAASVSLISLLKVTMLKSKDEEKAIESIITMVEDKHDIETFAQRVKLLSKKIFETTMEFSEHANIEYHHLNKIINDKLRDNAIVSRDAAIKICLALKLDFDEANELLSLAGYILCGNNKRNRLLSICVFKQLGVINANIILDKCGLPLLK